MITDAQQKVQAGHLQRKAYLYVRQSSMRQVLENTESTRRQYGLRQRAVALGWAADQVIVIDSDLGKSGASAVDREGFQRLVTEVGMGHAGLVMGLEVSRLARNCTDWHRLLEICALSDTLILDEDGLYDPAQFNDRLLLGLKGTMSEAELHLLRARLRGGVISKARRGELQCALPIGLIYDPAGRVVLDPDQQVQQAVGHFFRTFQRTGSAMATVKALRQQGLRFPRRVRSGVHKDEVFWSELTHPRALWLLHNPRYAGAFFFGRTRHRKRADGRTISQRLSRDEWISLIPRAHPGYISWDQFEEHQRRLLDNARAYGPARRHGPPREGPALLQGLVVCGQCGSRMTVRYHQRKGRLHPDYVCQSQGIREGRPICQTIPGAAIDKGIGELLVEAVSPLTLEVALTVQKELETRVEDVDRLRRKQVERARYEVELARRRYMQVDPDNRLVADELEREWNEKLRGLTDAQEEYERQKQADAIAFDEAQRKKILALATDFPRLWNDPNTPQRERKRMVRLLLEDVTLLKDDKVTLHVRFKGGTTKTLIQPIPLSAWQLRQTSREVVSEVDRLLDLHTRAEIVAILNAKGMRSGEGLLFQRLTVARIERDYGLKSRYARLRERGMLSLSEVARRLDVCPQTVNRWRRYGLLLAHAYNDRGECLYEPPGEDAPVRYRRKGVYAKRHLREFVLNRRDEVQYGT